MKRTHLFKLALLSVLLAMFAGCTSKPKVQTQFADSASCQAVGHGKQQCDGGFLTAETQVQAKPLIYKDQEACGQDWEVGTCVPVPQDKTCIKDAKTGICPRLLNPEVYFSPSMQGALLIWDKGSPETANPSQASPLYQVRVGRQLNFDKSVNSNSVNSNNNKVDNNGGKLYASEQEAAFLKEFGSEEPGVQPRIFTNLDNCIKVHQDTAWCKVSIIKANEQNKPAFGKEDDCLKEYKSCEHGPGSWLPVITAYIFGTSNKVTYGRLIYTTTSNQTVTRIYLATWSGNVGHFKTWVVSKRAWSSNPALIGLKGL